MAKAQETTAREIKTTPLVVDGSSIGDGYGQLGTNRAIIPVTMNEFRNVYNDKDMRRIARRKRMAEKLPGLLMGAEKRREARVEYRQQTVQLTNIAVENRHKPIWPFDRWFTHVAFVSKGDNMRNRAVDKRRAIAAAGLTAVLAVAGYQASEYFTDDTPEVSADPISLGTERADADLAVPSVEQHSGSEQDQTQLGSLATSTAFSGAEAVHSPSIFRPAGVHSIQLAVNG